MCEDAGECCRNSQGPNYVRAQTNNRPGGSQKSRLYSGTKSKQRYNHISYRRQNKMFKVQSVVHTGIVNLLLEKKKTNVL
jgi:hypothetical protein